MVIDIDPFLVAVGLMVFGAFVGSLVFKRFRLPDIILLVVLGVVLGPITDFVDVELFAKIAPLVGTVAIIIILFDGGLKVRYAEIIHGVASGSLLALLVFSATALLCGLVARYIIGVNWSLALLLGMALGGAGAAIVIPLIQQLGVGDRTKTIVSIEAATADVLVVVGVVGLSTALALKQAGGPGLDPGDFTKDLVQTFAVGVAVGIAAGLGWVWALKQFAERGYEYALTMAVLFLMYAGVEMLHGSGALAVLAFGLVVGNARKTTKVENPELARKKGRRSWQYAPVFGVDLAHLHEELVFFVRAFFFVALGVVINLDVLVSPRFIAVGLLLTLGVFLGRVWGVLVVLGRGKLAEWDKLAVTLMFPLGLAAAALSILPFDRYGIVGTEDFGSYAAVVIVLTNLLSSALVYVVNLDKVRAKIFTDAPEARERPWAAP
ncbi:MAG: cation:proton antiporter [Euryarchaeota archaeon]|nr:cation:proton antiporter [Euryarchaeota archaeon]